MRDLPQARGDIAGQVGGAAVLRLRRVDVLEPVVVDLEPLAGLVVGHLDQREQAVVMADPAVDEADRDIEAVDVFLDEHAVGIRARSAVLKRAVESRGSLITDEPSAPL